MERAAVEEEIRERAHAEGYKEGHANGHSKVAPRHPPSLYVSFYGFSLCSFKRTFAVLVNPLSPLWQNECSFCLILCFNQKFAFAFYFFL